MRSGTKQTQLMWEAINLSPLLVLMIILTTLAIFYMVGFAPMELAHNAFHDVRHATGFPCH